MTPRKPSITAPPRAGRINTSISITTLLALTYGASTTLFVNIVGQLYLSEILAFAVLIIVGPNMILRQSPTLLPVLVGYLIMLSGLLVADVMNLTSWDNAMRGAGNIVFAAINLMFLTYLLKRDLSALIPLLIGYGVARLINADLNDIVTTIGNDNAFKVNIVPFLTPIVIVFAYQANRYISSAWIMLLVGMIFAILGARSSGLMFFATGMLLVVQKISRRREARVFFVIAMVGIGYLAYISYVNFIFATESPGDRAYDQLANTSDPYNPFALLVQGRTAFLVALSAISEEWLVGRGSWAADQNGYYSLLYADLTGSANVIFSQIIISHSVVLTAWLWGGVLGLLGSVFILFTVLRRGSAVLTVPSEWRPIIAFLLVEFTWNFFFSPIGHIRTSFPIAIAATIVINEQLRRTGILRS